MTSSGQSPPRSIALAVDSHLGTGLAVVVGCGLVADSIAPSLSAEATPQAVSGTSRRMFLEEYPPAQRVSEQPLRQPGPVSC